MLQAPDAAAAGCASGCEPVSHVSRHPGDHNILDIDALSPQILELVFESIGADRGAILLKDESGQLVPKAVRWREAPSPTSGWPSRRRSSITCSSKARA